MTNHKSGLFAFQHIVPHQDLDGYEYHDCLLLQDVPLDKNRLSFHKPEQCQKGATLVVITQIGQHLCGFNDRNDIVLDIHL
jgi:hypothetical protein